jgi:hypothetical protein
MVYKQKLCILSGIVGVLALIYALTLVFDPERVGSRSAAFTWLDAKFLDQIDALDIHGPYADTQLVRKNNRWFVSFEGREYPARQLRVEDLLGALTRRGSYPVRAGAAASHERLGLGESAASRITVKGGAGLPLLDLLVGNADVSGRDVYVRKANQDEVRSGADAFTAYTASTMTSWYNLRLIPESEDGGLDLDDVQRLTLYYPTEGFEVSGGAVFTRSGIDNWKIDGVTVSNPDKNRIDAYIRGILNIEAEDFVSTVDSAAPVFNDGRVALELGDGSIRTIRLGPPDEETNQRYAVVSGSPFVYRMTIWAVDRLFRAPEYFERAQY